jgi:hypothetical protein
MPPPPNETDATAAAITVLPYSTSLDVSEATSPNYDVWWSFMSGTEGVVGFKANAASGAVDYEPRTTVWYGTPGSLTQLTVIGSGTATTINRPFYFPVRAGETYYLRVRQNNAGLTPDALLEVQAVEAPNQAIPTGSVLISTVEQDMPVCAIDATTGDVLGFPVIEFEIGSDYAETLPGSGVSCWPDGTDQFALFGPDLVRTDTVTGLSGYGPGQATPITSNRLDTFYVCAGGSGATMAKVNTITDGGVVGGTSWTLGHANVTTTAVNLAETRLYYARETGAATVFVWNLTTDTAAADLATHAGSDWRAYDIIVLDDESIVVLWGQVASPFEVEAIRYDAAGAVLNTYNFGTGTYRAKLAAHAPDDPVSFWLWLQGNGTAYFKRIRVSDGVAVADLSLPMTSAGVYTRSDYATAPTDDWFGPSATCPFLLFLQDVEALPPLTPGGNPPPPPPVPGPDGYTTATRTPRRMRVAPHLHQGNQRLVYNRLTVDMETGVGLNDGQGEDPQLMLQISNDGGHTYGNEIWQTFGRQGEYRTQVTFRRLGMARDRVFKLVISDPVRVRIVGGELDVEAGTD